MANHIIGELELFLGGRSFLLRPSFRCLSEIEDKAGISVLKIASAISDGDIKLKYVVAIVWGGYIGGLGPAQRPDITFDQLGELIYKANFVQLTPKVIQFFGGAIKGDPDNPPETQKKTL